MSQELLERATTTSVSRRTVVKTGAKLAYAVPLVAASFKLSDMGALAEDHTCSCIDDSRSPKPGRLIGGDPDTCYVCKGETEGTTVCGQTVTGSIQATGPNTCSCQESEGGGCTVNGVPVAAGAAIDCAPLAVDCGGGGTQSLP